MRFVKSALTVTIAMASTSALAVNNNAAPTNVDGYDFSGHTARSQALQLDYFAGHQDSGDIFVNPALVGQYANRVDINVDKGNNGAKGDGGVFFQNGANTVGVYIGRDNASNFGSNIQGLVFDNLDNSNGDIGNYFDVDETNPQSQFDLFYGFDTDSFAIGARLNYQANEQKDSNAPYTTGLPNNFSSIDEFLAHRNANYAAGVANQANPAPQAPYNGTLTPETTADSWKYKANEINLSVGFALKELNIDGAILYGKASGSFKNNENGLWQNVVLEPNATDNTKQDRYTTYTDQWNDSLTYELDKGETLGLSLRGQVFETEDSKLTISGSFVKQDYTVKYSSNEQGIEKLYAGNAIDDNDLEYTDTDTYRESGKLKDERTSYQVLGAFEKSLDDATKLTVFSGIKYTEIKNGYSFSIDQALLHKIDHTDDDSFENSYGTVGAQDSEFGKEEFTSIPLVIAVEHGFNERWTGRAAVSRDLYRNFKTSWTDEEFNAVLDPNAIDAPDANAQDQSWESGPTTTYRTNAVSGSAQATWANQPTTATIGLGYTRGNFNIDTVLGNNFFTQGTNNGVFGAASLGYKF